ncbi:hypothetical protein L0222_21055 [bacterium]|nr:hypothetical protein [bacterium]MCI0603742.1 hypothetical protein [bacterium]
MTDTYSVLLGMALVATIASGLSFLLSKRRIGLITGILGLFLCALAGVLHFMVDHNQSQNFFDEHPAILVIGILAIGLTAGTIIRNRS